VVRLPLVALRSNRVKDLLGFFGKLGELGTEVVELLALVVDVLDEELVVIFLHQDFLEVLDGLLLLVLYLLMVLQIIVHYTHLLEHLEENFGDIVFVLDNVEGLPELLLVVLPLHPLHLENVKGDLAHLNGVELGRPGVLGLAHESRVVTLVILLVLHDLCGVVLVEFVVHVEEVDAVYVDVIHVLVHGVARGHSDVAELAECAVALAFNALLEGTIWANLIVDTEPVLIDSELDINFSTVKIEEHAVVVRGGQAVHCSVNGEPLEALVVDGHDPPLLLVLE